MLATSKAIVSGTQCVYQTKDVQSIHLSHCVIFNFIRFFTTVFFVVFTTKHDCVFTGDTGPEVVTFHSAGRGSEGERVQKLHR